MLHWVTDVMRVVTIVLDIVTVMTTFGTYKHFGVKKLVVELDLPYPFDCFHRSFELDTMYSLDSIHHIHWIKFHRSTEKDPTDPLKRILQIY